MFLSSFHEHLPRTKRLFLILLIAVAWFLVGLAISFRIEMDSPRVSITPSKISSSFTSTFSDRPHCGQKSLGIASGDIGRAHLAQTLTIIQITSF
jgi:hypothetical protein